jgi:hypothetical protein
MDFGNGFGRTWIWIWILGMDLEGLGYGYEYGFRAWIWRISLCFDYFGFLYALDLLSFVRLSRL